MAHSFRRRVFWQRDAVLSLLKYLLDYREAVPGSNYVEDADSNEI